MRIRRIAPFTLALSLLAGAAPADYVWIGGNQAGDPNSFTNAANWAGGLAPVYASYEKIWVTQECAYVTFDMRGQVQNFYFGGLVLGNEDGAEVTFEITSTRPAYSPAVFTSGTTQSTNYYTSLFGTNTRVIVRSGAVFSFNSGLSMCDPGVSITGDGALSFGGTQTIFGRDYGTLPVELNQGARTMTAQGDSAFPAGLTIHATGSAGIDKVTLYDIAGHTVTAGTVFLGIQDVDTGKENDQSGFGAIELNGGTFAATDIVFRSNPDGTYQNQNPLTQDSYIADTAGGGTLAFSGDFADVTSRSPAQWNLSASTLRANGDGSTVQRLEALSRDQGDSVFAVSENRFIGTLEIAAGARVRLQDEYDNDRVDGGAAEVLYVGSLVVAEGATLDLNGLDIYAHATDLRGTLTENGGAIRPLTSTRLVFSVPLFLDDGTDTYGAVAAGTHGTWGGLMVATDIDGDGKLEIVLPTIDEDGNDGDDFFWCADFDGESLTLKHDDAWPVAAPTAVTKWIGLVDRGFGLGEEIVFLNSGWAALGKLAGDGSISTVTQGGNIFYATLPTLGDIDGDGDVEIFASARANNNNIRIVNARTGAAESTFNIIEKNAAGISQMGGFSTSGYGATERNNTLVVFDYDRDGQGEIFLHDNQNGNGYLKIYRNDGTLVLDLSSEGKQGGNFGLADFDKDGVYEIAYAGKVFDTDGTVLATLPGVYAVGTGLALADFTGDQIPEVVYYVSDTAQYPGYGKSVNIYDVATGTLLEGCPIRCGDGTLRQGSFTVAHEYGGFFGSFHHWGCHEPLVADLDNDGDWEIITVNGTSTGYLTINGEIVHNLFDPALTVIDYPTPYRLPPYRTALEMAWRTHNRDAQLTGIYPLPIRAGTLLLVR